MEDGLETEETGLFRCPNHKLGPILPEIILQHLLQVNIVVV
jgi:hypothetical protein